MKNFLKIIDHLWRTPTNQLILKVVSKGTDLAFILLFHDKLWLKEIEGGLDPEKFLFIDAFQLIIKKEC